MKTLLEYIQKKHIEDLDNDFLSGKYIYKNGYQDIPIQIDKETGNLFLQELGTGYNKDHFIEELTDILNKIKDNATVSYVNILGDKRNTEYVRFIKRVDNYMWHADIYFSITSAEFYMYKNKHIYYDDNPDEIIQYIVDKLNEK